MTESEPVEVVVVSESIGTNELKQMASKLFDDMVKAVVDVELRVIALGGDLHSDEESLLLQRGSEQRHLWGINIYPGKPRSEWIEFDSLINIRPRDNNRSRCVEDPATRLLITEIVDSLVR